MTKKSNNKKNQGLRSNVTDKCGGRRGCSVTITLPNDGIPSSVYMGLLSERDDIQAVLPMADVTLDTLEKKAG